MLKRIFRADNLPFLIAMALLYACTQMSPVAMERQVYDIQVIFDISQSMNVEDVENRKHASSRLELSRAAAQFLLASLPCGSRVGWGAFTGRRSVTLLTPLEVCEHHAGLLSSLQQIDGRMRWVEGSSIGKGVHQAMRAAQTIGDEVSLVFISDGHEAPPLRHGQSGIPRVDGLKVKGLLVGVGGDSPAPIPMIDAEGRIYGYWQAHEVVQRDDQAVTQSHEELSRRQDEHLLKLSQYSGLGFLVLDSERALADTVLESEYSHPRLVPVDIRWMPGLAALLLLGWRFSPGS